eukprot:347464-Chlamydomonas_euryale.AAC.8
MPHSQGQGKGMAGRARTVMGVRGWQSSQGQEGLGGHRALKARRHSFHGKGGQSSHNQGDGRAVTVRGGGRALTAQGGRQSSHVLCVWGGGLAPLRALPAELSRSGLQADRMPCCMNCRS